MGKIRDILGMLEVADEWEEGCRLMLENPEQFTNEEMKAARRAMRLLEQVQDRLHKIAEEEVKR